MENSKIDFSKMNDDDFEFIKNRIIETIAPLLITNGFELNGDKFIKNNCIIEILYFSYKVTNELNYDFFTQSHSIFELIGYLCYYGYINYLKTPFNHHE